jgi:hypothetical protein
MDVSKHYKWLLVVFGIWPILDILLSLQSINLPIIRYVIYTLGTFYVLKLYFASTKKTSEVSFILKIILSFTLLWLLIRFLISSIEIFNPEDNYVALKSTLSGEFVLFFSFYLANITMPLKYFFFYLKISYILAIIFVFIGIPLFGFFTFDIANQAEQFVKYFYLGGVFLLLLFPYQKTKVNIVLVLGLISATIMMLLLARRNVVLYLVTVLFFLALVIIFSKTELIKKRKPILLAVSAIIGLCTIVFVIFMKFNFNFFLERADSGFESRDMIFLEFYDDFNLNPIDWYIGRGPFGAFSSIMGNEMNNKRLLIENGYFQYILKQGLFFLIPFIIVSIAASFNGFFRSKNHLSKAAAILIIVNLIDMFGYGLPFLGLKYLNLLIAFGFCFSPTIRNMNDFEIRKIIRL